MINIDKINMYNNNSTQMFKSLKGYLICIDTDENNPAGKEVDEILYTTSIIGDAFFTEILNDIIKSTYDYIVEKYGIKSFDVDITIDMFFFDEEHLQITLNIGEIYE